MSIESARVRPLQLFYSYAPEDEALRQELENHLSSLKRQGIITDWHRRNIKAGTVWIEAVDAYLNAADIILLLISANFLASDYCYSVEMKRALERHEAQQARVIPILLRPVDVEKMPFYHLQPLPANGKPIVTWSHRDEAFLHIVQGIRQVADALQSTSQDNNTAHTSTPSSQETHEIHQVVSFENKTLSEWKGDRIPSNIFYFNQRLPSPNEFYGRKRERLVLLDRVRKGESTSIVGSRRIGKTWLIQYLQFVAREELGSRFIVGYLDVTVQRCATVAGFSASTLEALTSQKNEFASGEEGLLRLEQVVRELHSSGQVPVLCIDEFEGFGTRQEFDLHFFTTMRALTQEGLCLVVVSKEPLIKIVGERGKTSGFFNVFEQRKLAPFDMKEARQFVQSKGYQAELTDPERQRILDYGEVNGEYWPIRLQLVGKMVLEDKILAMSEHEQDFYRPTDPAYWREFKGRLEDIYRGAVT